MSLGEVLLPVDVVQREGVAQAFSRRHSLPQRYQVVGTEHALVVCVRMVDLCQIPRELQCPRQAILRRASKGSGRACVGDLHRMGPGDDNRAARVVWAHVDPRRCRACELV